MYPGRKDPGNEVGKGSAEGTCGFLGHNTGTKLHYIVHITEGYKMPFYESPQRASFENNYSVNAHKDFVTKSIQELLVTGRIVQTAEENLLVISSLSVSVNKDKKRLILDLRYVNQHIYKQKIKFEDWRTAMNCGARAMFGTALYSACEFVRLSVCLSVC